MLTPAPSAPLDRAVATPADGPLLALGHAAWAVAAVLLTLVEPRAVGIAPSVFYACLAMALPGLAGLVLAQRAGPVDRLMALAAWTAAALVAAAFTAGLTGPLGAFVFMPLVAGVALGGAAPLRWGALGSGLAALGGVASLGIAGEGPVLPMTSAAALLAAALGAVAAGALAWRRARAGATALERRIARLEGLLAHQPARMLLLAPGGRILSTQGGDLVGMAGSGPLLEAVHAPDRPRVAAALEQTLRAGSATVAFAPRAALDRRIEMVMSRLNEPEGPRLLAQAFDATAGYSRELALDAARAEAEARETAKSRFLANLSHELRTPLNAVLGFADIMRQRIFGALPPRYEAYADNIHQAGGHLLDLINDVLDVSKIEAERYALTLERFDAREPVSEALALMRGTAADKDVRLSAATPFEPIRVSADRRALKQMVLNLLSNAVKFTPSGGVVTVSVEVAGPWLEIAVSDTGVGIAPADLDRLGRPFEQAGAIEQRRQGTGLGLSLVRAFAELHGGDMAIESVLGEGASVTVRLPVVQQDRATPHGGAEIIPLNAGQVG